MTFRAALSDEHAELDLLAVRLLEIIRHDSAPPEDFSTVRWRMTHVLTVHLAKEDKHLYPVLLRSPDAFTRDLAMTFSREMGGLSDAYRAHIARWPLEKVRADWAGYQVEAWRITMLLRQRIRREESQLYVRLRAA